MTIKVMTLPADFDRIAEASQDGFEEGQGSIYYYMGYYGIDISDMPEWANRAYYEHYLRGADDKANGKEDAPI